MLARVDAMMARMRTLKRKLADLGTQSDRALRVAQARVDHLAALPDSIQQPEYAPWARRRLSHQLVDYFLRANPPLKDTARLLADHEGIADLVDDDLWDDMAKVERGLDEHRLDDVLSWVGENRTALKKLKVRSLSHLPFLLLSLSTLTFLSHRAQSPLEFRIHLQAYIELCRKRDLVKAIAYARKHLSHAAAADLEPPSANGDTAAGAAAAGPGGTSAIEGGSGSYMGELQQVLALLAYGPATTCRPYQVRSLLSPSPSVTLPRTELSPLRMSTGALRAFTVGLPALPLPHDLPLAPLAPVDPAPPHVAPGRHRLAQDAHLRPAPGRDADCPAVGVPARREALAHHDHAAGRDRPRGADAGARTRTCVLLDRSAHLAHPDAVARARPGPRARGRLLGSVPAVLVGAARARRRGPLLAPRQLDDRVPAHRARRRGRRRRGRAARRAREPRSGRGEGLLARGASSGLAAPLHILRVPSCKNVELTRRSSRSPLAGTRPPGVAASRGQARRARHGRGL